MPVLIALTIRAIIQAAVTIGILSIAEKVILPLVNAAIAKTIELFGVSEEDAQAFVANGVIGFAEEVGILALTLRTKLPVKVSERLGFTSKGFNKRPVSAAGAKKLPTTASTPKVGAKPSAADATEVAQQVAKTRGISFDTVSKAASIIVATLGVPVGVGLLITNTIDFGAWNSSAYQQSFQKFLSFFGLEPDKDARAPRTTSKETFDKVYNALRLEGATTIRDPYKDQILQFSRDNLLDLTDKLAAGILVESGQVLTKTLLAAILPLISFGAAKPAPTVAAPAPTVAERPSVPSVRVFSGVVSSGVIGSTATFTPRPDDLIENAAEITEAAFNNLAPFIAALPARMSYEIKVVPSIKTASGFTQRGTAQRVVSGYNRDGSPKYRTVVNKFAIMDIYVRTDRGSQTKITTIVLGPVDSVKFQGANVDLGAVAVDVQKNITTAPETPQAIPKTIPAPIIPIPATGVFQSKNPPFFGTLYKLINGSRVAWSPFPELYTQEERDKLSQDPGKFAQNEQKLKERGVITSDIVTVPFIADRQPGETGPERAATSFAEFFGMAAQVAQPTPESPRTGVQATTLFEYYKAHEQPLPSVAERAKLYEQLGLGKEAYYTGTAEQNTKLLAALQGAPL